MTTTTTETTSANVTTYESELHVPFANLECPGPNCPLCNGEACNMCGAGCWDSSVDDCEHDVIDRHGEPIFGAGRESARLLDDEREHELRCEGMAIIIGITALANWARAHAGVDPHCTLRVVGMRNAKGAVVCIDDECDLSGGFAHVGPCEPCGCPLRHAIAECNDR